MFKFALFAAPALFFGVTYYVSAKESSNNSKHSRHSYYQEAMHLLKGYKPALDNLGEPIKTKTINENDPFNSFKENTIRMKLPVEGKNRTADVFVYASKAENDRNWSIKKLEIQYAGSAYKYKIFDNDLRKS